MASEASVCRRAGAAFGIDGDLGKPVWEGADKTPRFVRAADGGVTLLDTRAAFLWDDACLYAAFWMEERDLRSSGEARKGLVWQENAAVLCLAGPESYYQLAVNPLNRAAELAVIWKDSYRRGGRFDADEFDLARQRPAVYGGDGGPHHPRGMRWAFYGWRLPGLRTAVRLDGTLDDRENIDRGWTVELALPWDGLARLLDGVPRDGETRPVAPARTRIVEQRASRFLALWSPRPMGDLHDPGGFPPLRFSAEESA